MKNEYIEWKKMLFIAIGCATLDIFLHSLLPPYRYDYPPSYFVEKGRFIPAASICLAIIFLLLALVFVSIQTRLGGNGLAKGIRFGIVFGGLWFVGMPGMSVFFDSPLSHELLGGAADGLSVLALGLLLGLFVAEDGCHTTNGKIRSSLVYYPVIVLAFVAGQYFAFILMSDLPRFDLTGAGAFMWTLALGMWMSLVFHILKEGMKGSSPIQRALWFGGICVGINWLLYNLFVLLFVDLPVLNPIILAICNILPVIAAVFVVERFVLKIDRCAVKTNEQLGLVSIDC